MVSGTSNNDDAMSAAVTLLKYEGVTRLGKWFAARLKETLERDSGTFQPDVVVPVPLHPLRRHLDKCRLAYPGFTGNENDLTVSAQGLLQHAFQNPQGTGPSDPPAFALVGRIVRNGSFLLERMLDIGMTNRVDGGNEPISAPR